MVRYEKPYPTDKRPFLVVRKDPIRLEVRQATIQGYATCYRGGVFDAAYVNSVYRRGRVQGGGKVSPTITSASAETLLIFEGISKNIL